MGADNGSSFDRDELFRISIRLFVAQTPLVYACAGETEASGRRRLGRAKWERQACAPTVLTSPPTPAEFEYTLLQYCDHGASSLLRLCG